MRQTAIMISCDNPDCEVAVPIPSEEETPPGWYLVIPVREPGSGNGKRSGVTAQRSLHDAFTLCSLDCVGAWGLYRQEALSANAS